MSNYIGIQPETIISALSVRYFYGLRRTDKGELFLGKIDQLSKTDVLTINRLGDIEENFPNFEENVDYFNGRDAEHNIVYDNLYYEQFRWDNRNIFYYINDEGEFVVRINASYNYDTTVSSEGLE